ncbi:MAG: GDYXXLXY domain-containing protein [Synergistaceae bacterium]|jgi:uncharacterized membrane-anchored protein|nr:GDYXXLXY domain-containing protein [Synergistaceae bacterium]
MRAFFKSLALKYAAIAILPLSVLLYQPAVNFTALAWGERVLLRTRPVDPRDFLRGDYVTLDYDISDVPEDLLPEGSLPDIADDTEADSADRAEEAVLRSGWKRYRTDRDYYRSYYRDLYVTLKLDGNGVGSIAGVSFTRPSGRLYLKGTIVWQWQSYSVDYGLGVYYVPEGTGRELEEAVRKGSVLADVRVLRGYGVLKNLETAAEGH